MFSPATIPITLHYLAQKFSQQPIGHWGQIYDEVNFWNTYDTIYFNQRSKFRGNHKATKRIQMQLQNVDCLQTTADPSSMTNAKKAKGEVDVQL